MFCSCRNLLCSCSIAIITNGKVVLLLISPACYRPAVHPLCCPFSPLTDISWRSMAAMGGEAKNSFPPKKVPAVGRYYCQDPGHLQYITAYVSSSVHIPYPQKTYSSSKKLRVLLNLTKFYLFLFPSQLFRYFQQAQ